MLTVKNISYQYRDQAKKALNNINFRVDQGDILAIVGESGGGKSTLIKLIYGILDATEGTVHFKDFQILGPKFNLVPGHDDIKYLSQHLELVNYATVYDNVGKYISNIDNEFKKNRVETILESVGLLDVKHKIPKDLSGGQKQRVALARAIAKTPQLLILDEPFANIDTILKYELRDNLFELFKKLNISIIFSTHDLQDALGFADKLLVIKGGEVVQFGKPISIYNSPVNLYVAQLFGYATEFSESEVKEIFGISKPSTNIFYAHDISLNEIKIDYTIKRTIFLGNKNIYKVKTDNKTFYCTS